MTQFFIKLGAVTCAVLILYFVMSPYQRCVRQSNDMDSYIDSRETIQRINPNAEYSLKEFKQLNRELCSNDHGW
jgi:hypothetical protein